MIGPDLPNHLQLEPAEPGRLACMTTTNAGVISLAISGSGEMGDQEPLAQFLKRVHEHALKINASKVEVSFDLLQFMNSSCFKSFVTWFAALVDSAKAGNRYLVHIKMNPTRRWQRASVSALACFAPELVSFE